MRITPRFIIALDMEIRTFLPRAPQEPETALSRMD
jgi:hypothetical protein